jgi:hypothetical protein
VLLAAVILARPAAPASPAGVRGAPHPAVRVRIDPGLLTGSEEGIRPLTPEEHARLLADARLCLVRVRQVLARPATRAHFRRVYGLDSARLLDRAGLVVLLRTFPVRWDVPAAERTVQVGAYMFGEMSVSLNAQLLLAARDPPLRDEWLDYAAGVVVHELAHLADFLDNGLNDDGRIATAGEEGEEAQRSAGCFHRLPAPLAPMGRILGGGAGGRD